MLWDQSTGRDTRMVGLFKKSDELLQKILQKVVPDHQDDKDENDDKKDIEKWKEKFNEAEQKIHDLEKQLKDATPHIDNVKKLKEQMQIYKDQSDGAHLTQIAQRNDIEDAHAKNKALAKELEQLRKEFEECTNNLALMTKDRDKLVMDVKSEKMRSAMEMAKLQKTIKELTDQVKRLQSDEDEGHRASTMAMLQDQNHALRTKITNAEQQEAKVVKELTQLRANQEIMKSNIEEQYNTRLIKKEEEWKQKVEKLEEQVKEAVVAKPKAFGQLGVDNPYLYEKAIDMVREMLLHDITKNSEINPYEEPTDEQKYAQNNPKNTNFNIHVLKKGIEFLYERFQSMDDRDSPRGPVLQRRLSNASSVMSETPIDTAIARDALDSCHRELEKRDREYQQLQANMHAEIKQLQEQTGAATYVCRGTRCQLHEAKEACKSAGKDEVSNMRALLAASKQDTADKQSQIQSQMQEIMQLKTAIQQLKTNNHQLEDSWKNCQAAITRLQEEAAKKKVKEKHSPANQLFPCVSQCPVFCYDIHCIFWEHRQQLSATRRGAHMTRRNKHCQTHKTSCFHVYLQSMQ